MYKEYTLDTAWKKINIYHIWILRYNLVFTTPYKLCSAQNTFHGDWDIEYNIGECNII